MVRRITYLVVTLAVSVVSYGQELNFTVILDDEQVQTQDRQIFGEMQSSITTFLNDTKWTDDEFEEEEHIQGNILITFLTNGTDVAAGVYSAQAQIQSSRPIYGTDYASPVLNFFDSKFNFRYQPSEPLIFTENVTQNNLTSMLAYYAYAVIGMDYDTFSEFGGNPYYEKMRNITNNLNASTNITRSEGAGWLQDDTRNRIWLSEDLNNAGLQDVRTALYRYHRHGLDRLIADGKAAREEMLKTLRIIQTANNQLPNSILIAAFFDAKSTELYQTFTEASNEAKKEAGDILKRVDPTNVSKYNELSQ